MDLACSIMFLRYFSEFGSPQKLSKTFHHHISIRPHYQIFHCHHYGATWDIKKETLKWPLQVNHISGVYNSSLTSMSTPYYWNFLNRALPLYLQDHGRHKPVKFVFSLMGEVPKLSFNPNFIVLCFIFSRLYRMLAYCGKIHFGLISLCRFKSCFQNMFT